MTDAARSLPFASSRVAVADRLARAWPDARRLGLGSVGPIAVAAAQFAASMLLWSHVSAAQFGLFAFALLLVQLSFGLSNALVGTPLAVAPTDADRALHERACLAAHGVFLLLAALAIGGLLLAAGAGWAVLAFAVHAVAANLRWAARSFVIAEERVGAAAQSDAAYAAAAGVSFAVLVSSGQVGIAAMASALALANIAALALHSRGFLVAQLAALTRADIARYRRSVWPQQAGWSVIGVVATEASSNAHAYLVTALHGAAVYAPLAFGALFCRPLTIFLTALTQIDRPRLARHLRGGDRGAIGQVLRLNYVSAALVWIANLALALAVLHWFADRIAARGYDAGAIRVIVLLWFAIMALRAMRTPVSTFLQADGAFRYLAFSSIASSLVSVAGCIAFLAVGTTYSLAGILCGEALLLALAIVPCRRRLA